MSANAPPAEPEVICDTVVVNYFLAVGRFDLLRDVLGGTVFVPRAVFDADEPADTPELLLSELRRGLRHHERRAVDQRISAGLRGRSQRALPHFQTLDALADSGHLRSLDLTDEELVTYARLRESEFVRRFGVTAGLGRGEAAALALAERRGSEIATDDDDAIKVGSKLIHGFRHIQIPQLLRRSAKARLVPIATARQIYREMLEMGFWGKVQP